MEDLQNTNIDNLVNHDHIRIHQYQQENLISNSFLNIDY